MKRLVPAAALVAVVLLTAAILSASGSAQGTGERTITLIERDPEGLAQVVDNPPRADRELFRGGRVSIGDAIAFHQPLRNRAGRRVGALDVSCTATLGGSFERAGFTCHGAYALKRGSITAQGTFGAGRPERVAVTGGTGLYEGATGSVKSTERRGTTTVRIHLLG
jgi:hypothetical protein